MDFIEYENGLPKGYLKRRREANILYICSIYLYCLFNVSLKTKFIEISDSGLYNVLNSSIIILSCILLCRCILTAKNYKGILMYNHSKVKVLSKKEKLLYFLPVIIFSVFIPLNMIIYLLIAGFIYLAVNSFDNKSDHHDSYI